MPLKGLATLLCNRGEKGKPKTASKLSRAAFSTALRAHYYLAVVKPINCTDTLKIILVMQVQLYIFFSLKSTNHFPRKKPELQ